MEQLGGGGCGGRGSVANRILNHHRGPPFPSDRLLGVFQPQYSSATPPLELSEHDIFSSPSGSSSPSNVDPSPIPSPTQNAPNHNKSHGILAALNDNIGTKTGSGSGSGARPVFNHKASTSASLSSSSSTSPAASFSARIMIPKRPPPLPQLDRMRLFHQSAPVNVPVIPEAMRRRAMEFDEVLSEKDEEEENGVILPPHEVVAARNSPMLAFSVLEGAGRTLKGRDLRQDFFYTITEDTASYLASVEMNRVIIALFFTSVLARAEHFNGQILTGSVTCLDCNHDFDLSGIRILAKCDKLKKFGVAYTEEDGSFETELPPNDQKSSNPLNCIAKIMGGPKQLYTASNNYVAVVSKANEPNHFTTSKSLDFYKSCPLKGKCGVGASKTVDLPLPREWGLAPSSYYIYPFLPIIGIP